MTGNDAGFRVMCGMGSWDIRFDFQVLEPFHFLGDVEQYRWVAETLAVTQALVIVSAASTLVWIVRQWHWPMPPFPSGRTPRLEGADDQLRLAHATYSELYEDVVHHDLPNRPDLAFQRVTEARRRLRVKLDDSAKRQVQQMLKAVEGARARVVALAEGRLHAATGPLDTRTVPETLAALRAVPLSKLRNGRLGRAAVVVAMLLAMPDLQVGFLVAVAGATFVFGTGRPFITVLSLLGLGFLSHGLLTEGLWPPVVAGVLSLCGWALSRWEVHAAQKKATPAPTRPVSVGTSRQHSLVGLTR